MVFQGPKLTQFVLLKKTNDERNELKSPDFGTARFHVNHGLTWKSYRNDACKKKEIKTAQFQAKVSKQMGISSNSAEKLCNLNVHSGKLT